MVLEKTLESPLDCKKIQPVHPKDQSWVFTGRNDAKAETPVLWPPHVKSWLIGKNHDAGRDWGQEEQGTTEDEMAGWHHRLDGRESEWTPGVGDGQGGLACCNSWGHKESDTTEWTEWSEYTALLERNRNNLWTLGIFKHVAFCTYVNYMLCVNKFQDHSKQFFYTQLTNTCLNSFSGFKNSISLKVSQESVCFAYFCLSPKSIDYINNTVHLGLPKCH